MKLNWDGPHMPLLAPMLVVPAAGDGADAVAAGAAAAHDVSPPPIVPPTHSTPGPFSAPQVTPVWEPTPVRDPTPVREPTPSPMREPTPVRIWSLIDLQACRTCSILMNNQVSKRRSIAALRRCYGVRRGLHVTKRTKAASLGVACDTAWFMMDDPNITMEEYIRIQAQKARRHDFEADFPTIVYNDAFTSNENVSSDPTIWLYYPENRDIYGLVNWVYVLDVAGLTEEMGQTLADKMRVVYTGTEGHVFFTSHAWRRLFEIRALLLGGARRRMTWREFILALGLHTTEEMVEVGLEVYWLGNARAIPDKGDPRDYWNQISSDRDFLGVTPSFTFIQDPARRLCHKLISYSISRKKNVLYLLAQYLFRHAEGRKNGSRMTRGYFIGRHVEHFGLVSDVVLMGLFVIACMLLVINLDKLIKLNIFVRLGDTLAWVASGLKRQLIAGAGAPEVFEGALDVDEGAQAIPAPVHAPHSPPAATRTMP
uniref:Uncharacterized protein n=1 Tax=Tanacetum cinerariifolium TaxID=118510 RepID=A0A6L2L6G7_TANCI|nr:hypothetical protein [Tanacetum cinerariifolium]